MSHACPSCATASTGRFCPDCGAALDAACRECRAPLVPGARFCNQCGTSATPAAGPGGRRTLPLPWVAAAVAGAVVATVALLYERDTPVQPAAFTAAAAPAGGITADELAAMPPREAADRLFNRVMHGVASGDTADLPLFTRMAVQAYARVPERDADLHYHLGELFRLLGDGPAVRAQGDSILAGDPGHLFGLFTAARGEAMLGDEGTARGYYRRFLDRYAEEVARNLPEYQEHAPGLPSMRAEAEEALGAR
jgi:hypothetical protein